MFNFNSSTCRVCLAACDNMSPIFKLRDSEINVGAEDPEAESAAALRDKLEYVARVQLVQRDDLPHGICAECRAALEAAYAFAARCAAAEAMFLEAIKAEVDVKIESTSSEELRKTRKVLDNDDDTILMDGIMKDEQLTNNDLPTLMDGSVKDEQLTDNSLHSEQEEYSLGNPPAKPKKKDKMKRKRIRKKKSLENLQCNVCGSVSRCGSALRIHMRKHSGEKPYQCVLCGKTFTIKGTLARHIENTHTTERPLRPPAFTCEVCGKQFVRKRDVAIHLRIHTGELPHACSYCPKRFSQLGGMIRHQRALHTGERPFLCSRCPKRFADATSLATHAHAHSDERRHSCPTCGKRFKTKNSLNKHVDRHIFGKKHVCDKCGTSFTLKGNLKLHVERRHSDLSGICPICEKSVPDVSDHVRRHNGERYPCTICNKSFLTASGLHLHLGRHQNADKYKCSVVECQMGFATTAMLQYHVIKTHTGVMPYRCSECVRSFVRSCDLTKHLKIAHKILKSKDM